MGRLLYRDRELLLELQADVQAGLFDGGAASDDDDGDDAESATEPRDLGDYMGTYAKTAGPIRPADPVSRCVA